jgi:hypothetical protein
METTTLQPAQSEHDAHRGDAAGPAPAGAHDAAPEQGGWHAARAFGAAPGEPPGEGVMPLLVSRSLSHAANNGARAVAFRRAQQVHGNRYVQRLLAGAQRRPAGNGPRSLQRSCACGGTCPKCQAEAAAAGTEPTALSPEAPGEIRHVQAQVADNSGATEMAAGAAPAELIPPGEGAPLDRGTRRFMESRFGADLGDVRVHTDGRAAASADAIGADAYATGRDIYFAAGKYAPEQPAGQHLLAHELAHTVQQSEGEAPAAPAAKSAAGVVIGGTDDPLEHEAERAADLVTAQTPGTVASPSLSRAEPAVAGSLRRQPADDSGDEPSLWDRTAGRVINYASEKVGEAIDSIEDWVIEKLEKYAPGLLALLRGGLGEYLKEKIASGLDSVFGGLISRIQKEGLVGALGGIVGELASAVHKGGAQLASDICKGLATAARAVGEFASAVGTEVFDSLKKAASAVGGFFQDLWQDLGAPAWKAIKTFAIDVWTWIEEKAKWIWDKTAPIREGFTRAWNWIKDKFNLAWDTGAGVLDWLKDKAAAGWEKIKTAVQPILGPLKVIGGIFLLLSPLGPVIAIYLAAPYVWDALKWLAANWHDLTIVVKARQILHDRIIPAVMSGVQAVTGLLDTAAKWLSEKAQALSAAIGSLMDALGVTALLRLARNAVGFLADQVKRFVSWARGELTDLMHKARDVLHKVADALKPVWEVLKRLAFIVLNPLGPALMFAGAAWTILPECIKGPIINFILDLIIALVRRGPLFSGLIGYWDPIRDALLPHLEAFKKLSVPERVARVNEVALKLAKGGGLEQFSNLISAVAQFPGEFEGQAEEELIGTDLTKPLPFERTAPTLPENAEAPPVAALDPSDQAVLSKTHLQDGELTFDQIGDLELSPEFIDSLNLEEGKPIEFGRSNDPSRSVQAIQRDLTGKSDAAPAPAGGATPEAATPEEGGLTLEQQLDLMVAQQPAPPCSKEAAQAVTQKGAAPPEAMPEEAKIGPLTRGLRGHFVWESMKKGLAAWWGCNKSWLLPTLIVALIALAIATIVTEGAAIGVIGEVLEVVGAILLGVAAIRAGAYIAAFVVNAIAGDTKKAAQSLARGLAILAVELLMLILFDIGDIIKGFKGGLKGGVKAIGTSIAKPFLKGAAAATKLGKAGLRAVSGAARAIVENGRLVLQGAGRVVVANAIRTLQEFAELLWQRTRASFFKIVRLGERIFVQGCVNPCALMLNGKILKNVKVKGGRPEIGDFITLIDDPSKAGYIIGVMNDARLSNAARRIIEDMSTAERLDLIDAIKKATTNEEIRKLILGRSATAANSRELRKALLKAGETAADDAHHIVPSTHPLAKQAQDVLEAAKININDAVNGVFLTEAQHAGLHTHAYIQKINDLIFQAWKDGGRAEVLNELAKIKGILKSGGGVEGVLKL